MKRYLIKFKTRVLFGLFMHKLRQLDVSPQSYTTNNMTIITGNIDIVDTVSRLFTQEAYTVQEIVW